MLPVMLVELTAASKVAPFVLVLSTCMLLKLYVETGIVCAAEPLKSTVPVFALKVVGAKLPPKFINDELAVSVPVVKFPVTLRVPLLEKTIVFLVALLPIAIAPFTVSVPETIVTAQILVLAVEFTDVNPVQVTLPLPARFNAFVTAPVGTLIVIVPAVNRTPFATFNVEAVLLLFALIIMFPLIHDALIFTVAPAFMLKAAPDSGAPADQVPPAQAPLYVAVPVVRVVCPKETNPITNKPNIIIINLFTRIRHARIRYFLPKVDNIFRKVPISKFSDIMLSYNLKIFSSRY